ncbi:MAG: transport-associated protein [Deltaproteobacteria bacterium HGW-Deltaproteobacteria-15]|jgi:osmotically-inducible protein OsmY|nr:MAG: transport-associated protein [Deltaproteobacteria bacterium HGW-Deltaproteobacteria-15]
MVQSDELIKKAVVEQLTWDDRVDASKVSVEVENGTVILRGEVPSYFTRTAAQNDALKIVGVRRVVNEILIRPPLEPSLTDMEIENNIKEKLFNNPEINLRDIEVVVSAGTVTLRGTVSAYWKKMHADDLVSEQPGVVFIENLLAVVPTRDYYDQEIAKEIISALDRTVDVDPDEITVKVERGKVLMSGTVPNRAARQLAYEAAWFTPGVINVEDHLSVSELTHCHC